MKDKIKPLLIILTILGLADAIFLTYEHYLLISIGCPVSSWINCLTVTTSKYSEIFGIPLSLFGGLYYIVLLGSVLKRGKSFKHLFIYTSIFGVLFSTYLTIIQAFVIKSFCIYCLGSALISFTIFGLGYMFFRFEWNSLIIDTIGYKYKFVIKPILFLIDAELIHQQMVRFGENLPESVLNLFRKIFVKKYPNLAIKISGIEFRTPVGLAAGFDYEARLTKVLPTLGFGFESVGTLSNMPYSGNPRPMLGRLPKSKSLLVNKGYKNLGVEETLSKFKGKKFSFPVGISIGRTNSQDLNSIDKSIEDIKRGFQKALSLKINNAYMELNISCPNLIHNRNINFYTPSDLEKLLTMIDGLKIAKPVFVKMPIDQGDKKTLSLLKTISKHKVTGVIIGNLQTNAKHNTLNQSEVGKFKAGKFSGKPTFEDSNRLIKLTYKNFGKRFVIIGCGGIFSAEDAWVKFENGASLVQLITGLIFEGPQLVSQINRDLSQMLIKRGYKNISEVVGSGV